MTTPCLSPSLSPAPTSARDDLIGLITQLSLARGMDEVMAIVRQGARRLTGADGVTFVLRDGDLCFYADEDAVSPLWKGQRFPMSQCISGWAMLHREPVAIEDIYTDPRIPHDAYRLTFVKSLVMVPVRREDPVAAIGAYWARRHPPSPEEVDLLQAIANGAAVAMTNIALYRSLIAARAAAEKANETRSRFFAAANHDLSQPLQAMRLFHDVLDSRIEDLDQRRVLGLLGRAMDSAEALLHELQDVARLDGGLIAKPQSVRLATLLRDITGEMAPLAIGKGLDLRLAPGGEHAVATDPVLLRRVMSNLIGNAIRYTETGGVLVGMRRRRDHVVIEVWDTGIGIAPELHDLIFEDFFQVDNPARDRSKGTGRGLAIVRRLCALLNGKVGLASRPGRGSVFRVQLPFASPDAPEPADPATDS